ncbi:MAG: right-handed parallel beta-helix repeat-containing protein, partial [Saprospiraceae bacterium]
MRLLCLLVSLISGYWLPAQVPEIVLSKGLIIKQSCRVKPQTYLLAGNPADRFEPPVKPALALAVITIAGDHLTVDFQNAELRGTTNPARPDEFYGLAIRIKGRHITLKNARASGYKIALLAEASDSLSLENCDFSYNYRPRLLSTPEQENEADWLSYHHNEQHEWMRYGAGIYLDGCLHATIKGCHITGGQNALLMVGCSDGKVYNNYFQFNSGLGIGLYRSRRNRLMHNFLDWNVRGYSQGVYQRGQDSAGILLFEQCSNNLIAYNSATHSGDGFFLWAGQTTMDSGKGGCNDNLIFGNDFSYAPTNGVEVTFSRNRIQGNLITECTYGIWGGYSYETVIMGNLITSCGTGIAIEHGQQDTIRQNLFSGDSTGIQLWMRAEQPQDWGYAQKRDTRSRDHNIDRNVFGSVRKPLKISASQNISVNGENLFFNFDQLLTVTQPNEKLRFLRNDIFCRANQIGPLWQEPELKAWEGLNFSHPNQRPTDMYAALQTHYGELHEPDSLADGILAVLPAEHPRGRQWIIMDEWGP